MYPLSSVINLTAEIVALINMSPSSNGWPKGVDYRYDVSNWNHYYLSMFLAFLPIRANICDGIPALDYSITRHPRLYLPTSKEPTFPSKEILDLSAQYDGSRIRNLFP